MVREERIRSELVRIRCKHQDAYDREVQPLLDELRLIEGQRARIVELEGEFYIIPAHFPHTPRGNP